MRRRINISSILVGGAAALLMGQASARGIRPSAPTYEQTVEAIAACGVPAGKVRITYEDVLQSDLVRISDLGGSDEARLRCLRKAVHPYYVLDVSAAPQRTAYFEFEDRENRREARTRALAWLGARGKLAAVPRYDPGKGLETFARALEFACSIREESVLEALPPSGLTFRRSFMKKFSSDASDQFECLTHMAAASDADKHDVRLMLLGNEAHQTETPQ